MIFVSSEQFTYLINCWHDCDANVNGVEYHCNCSGFFIVFKVNSLWMHFLFHFYCCCYWLRRLNKFGNGSNCVFFMAHLGFYEHVSLALLNAFVFVSFFPSFIFFARCPVALLNADRKRVQLSEKTCSIKMNIYLCAKRTSAWNSSVNGMCACVFATAFQWFCRYKEKFTSIGLQKQ